MIKHNKHFKYNISDLDYVGLLTNQLILPGAKPITLRNLKLFGHFLKYITYPWGPAHKISKQTFSIYYSSYDSDFPKRCSQKEATKYICLNWIMPRGRAEGNATLWLRFPAIKAEGSGDQSWVRFWVFSCAKLDFVQKFLDWHSEHFSSKHNFWT